LLKKFQGQKTEYEYAINKTQTLFQWKYRIKLIEKIVYTVMMIFGFIFYRSPTMLHFAFIENGFYSICGISSVIIIFNYLGWYYENKFDEWDKRTKKLKAEQKDIKM
jgi:hypothetical protein